MGVFDPWHTLGGLCTELRIFLLLFNIVRGTNILVVITFERAAPRGCIVFNLPKLNMIDYCLE